MSDYTEMRDHSAEPQDPLKTSPCLLHGWMSRAELADELGLCVETLRRWADARRGPKFVRAGRKILYRRSTVLAWLEEQEGIGPVASAGQTRAGRRPGSKPMPRKAFDKLGRAQ